MRTIADMYKTSGGATIGKRCEECGRYKEIRTKKTQENHCTLYDLTAEVNPRWKGRFIACKFFQESQVKSNKRKRKLKGE